MGEKVQFDPEMRARGMSALLLSVTLSKQAPLISFALQLTVRQVLCFGLASVYFIQSFPNQIFAEVLHHTVHSVSRLLAHSVSPLHSRQVIHARYHRWLTVQRQSHFVHPHFYAWSC